MKSNGIFCFFIVVIVCSGFFLIAGQQARHSIKARELKQELLEIEQAQFYRSLMEENLDRVIANALEVQAKNAGGDHAIVSAEIKEEIKRFLNNAETEFIIPKTNALNNSFDAWINCFSVQGRKACTAFFVAKKDSVLGEITVGETRTEFLLPENYSQSRAVFK